MCTVPHAETRLPPPISPFLVAQNLSSKRIAPNDNVAKVRQRQRVNELASYCKPLSLTQYLYRLLLTHFQFTAESIATASPWCEDLLYSPDLSFLFGRLGLRLENEVSSTPLSADQTQVTN